MGNVRATQVVGYAIEREAANVRATQVVGYAIAKLATVGVRATQVLGYAVEAQHADVRVTQMVGYALVRRGPYSSYSDYAGGVPPCDTGECDCWRIERSDGVVYTFTSHDEVVTINGESYSPCGSLRSSALEISAEIRTTDNMDLSGILTDAGVNRADLFAGRFDGAAVQVFRASWQDSTVPAVVVAAGNCGAFKFGTSEYEVEVVTASQRLQQRPLLTPVMPGCRFKLGDSRCSFDLESLRVSGSVTALPLPNIQTGALRRIFSDSARSEANGYFDLGRLTWLTGANAGISVDVKSYSADTFILEQPMQEDIGITDTYSVTPGCDRVLTTCDEKFDNADNFGGFPYLRGSDDLGKRPQTKG